ncbi:hypothetical protein MBLNU459_g1929t3 [Dothideomycetes sp. NU459]
MAAIVATPPPLHAGPTSKEKKYDRQLRLWAAAGQAALEEAHVLLINSGPGVTGVETLKNLVLPGVGQYTILDSAVVSEPDLGVNFFLDESCLGGFRAEHTCKLLQELNPDVQGHFITEPVESFVAKEDALKPYTLILVAAPVTPDVLSAVSTYAHHHAIALFYFHSVGFYSHFSVALSPAFPIVDTHPDPASMTDLRLLKPWPALVQFTQEKTGDLKALSEHDLGHVPYLLLLLHFLAQWRSSHSGDAPSSYKEKSEFRELVRQAAPSPDEENFAEAVGAVLKSLNPSTPPSSVLAVLTAPETQNLSPASSSFWFIARGVYDFYKAHGELPLPGAVPDMKAQSADYIRLQNIYKAKAREDCAEVVAYVREHEKISNTTVDEKEIEQFCKGAAHIKLVRGRPLLIVRPHKRLEWGPIAAKNAASALMMPDSGILLYIAFVAWDSFVGSHDADVLGGEPSVPGLHDEQLESDADKMVGIAHSIVDGIIKEAGTFIENPEYDEIKEACEKTVRELVRAGSSELHNIAALTGGMLAQEVIKVITKQYVPIDNTCVFDGITSKSAILRL